MLSQNSFNNNSLIFIIKYAIGKKMTFCQKYKYKVSDFMYEGDKTLPLTAKIGSQGQRFMGKGFISKTYLFRK